jgi:hypothetical protein
MPRPKKINQSDNKTKSNMTRPNKLTEEIIRTYDCTGGKLYFKELSPIEKNIIATYYKLKLSEDGNGFAFRVKYSWKSLLQLMTAIYYLRKLHENTSYQGYLQHHIDIKLSKHIKIQTDYNFIHNRSEDEKWENLNLPTGYKNCYIQSLYRKKDIINGVNILIKTLEIDIKKSSFKIIPSNQDFVKSQPVPLNNHEDVVMTYFNAFNSIVFTNSTEMKKALNGLMRVFVALPLKSPQALKEYLWETQDVTYPYQFIAYPILEKVKSNLINYFPRQKETIEYFVRQPGIKSPDFSIDDNFLHTGCYYLITDIKSLGQWD